MGIFQNRLQKREVKNYIKEERTNLTYTLNACKNNFMASEVMIDKLAKCTNTSDEGQVFLQEKYTERIIENLNSYAKNMIQAMKMFESLKEYEEENSAFVSKNNKSEVETIDRIIKTFEQKLINLYSYFLVAVQIEQKHKNSIREEFTNVIKTLKLPVHTDEKTEEDKETYSVGDGISEGV